ncbi:DEAD-box ATP-dependent RNA helicase 32-like [Neltuma alba]|uniref:DEAD-box ATP-dependent RNA helicase 32-like n=1 Tax=Neltuma alba TaxID=207710 RepID=UPI0010A2F52F|nr:DEAD-box ATP-dependent RNA helicase 32-like [Prosopis alba]XP_028771541.1 DEAD-box ATP-dependent RNA helicase 32-like [Prosopis alba]
MRKPKSRRLHKQQRLAEEDEIKLLDSWIQSQKPDSGSNPMSFPPLSSKEPIGCIDSNTFSRYAGVTRFDQLPISKKTKDGLLEAKFVKMTDIQRASLPHALCGRDILGASKTGSGKTLAFIVPVLEKLYREKWGPEDGVGSIIISPTRELASQLFDVLKSVGKHHNFSAGLLIGGRKEVNVEKEHVNDLNILICTPGRLLQHMDETPNFDCSQIQVLVLDEADRILDSGFKKELNAIISQLPKHRQTLLFSATQTKSIEVLARLSLKDPEYLSVHQESVTATPTLLRQLVMIVPLDQKLDMLWSFIKSHLNSKILVFLSSCKQVTFVFEAFKKLRPGIPLKCLHGRMKQERRMGIYSEFCEKRSVLFSTDVAARGLDFNKAVDWVVQVDCPENVASYIHRVGRTARYKSGGRSVLFLMPSEMKMLEKLEAAKVPVHLNKPRKEKLQPVSGLLAALLVKYPDLQQWAKRAFITYLRSIHIQKDKEIFDLMKLPIDEYSASLGLPMTPKTRFLNQKIKSKAVPAKPVLAEPEDSDREITLEVPRKNLDVNGPDEEEEEEEEEKGLLLPDDSSDEREGRAPEIVDVIPPTRVSKKKKLKINIHRPMGTRVVFDDEGNALPPLARIADTQTGKETLLLDPEQKAEYYRKMREELKKVDKEDKLVQQQRRREKKIKQKMKWKERGAEEDDDDISGSEDGDEVADRRRHKKSKIYFDSDSDDDTKGTEVAGGEEGIISKPVTLEEQEALALKLLNSMHS